MIYIMVFNEYSGAPHTPPGIFFDSWCFCMFVSLHVCVSVFVAVIVSVPWCLLVCSCFDVCLL